MKFKKPRIVFDSSLMKIATREEHIQKTSSKMSKKDLSDLLMICKAVKKNGLPDYLVCKKLSKSLGSGIFLHPEAKPLKKGQIIGPYSGELVIAPENAPGDSCYVFSLMTDLHFKERRTKVS